MDDEQVAGFGQHLHAGVEFVVGDVFEVARFAAAAGGDEGFEGGHARL